MKRLVLMILLVLAATPMARADEASKKAKVQELFVVMHMERMMNQVLDQVTGQVKQLTQSMPGGDQLTEAQKKMVSEYQDKAMALAREAVDWKVLEPQYVTLYASTYSEEEIDGILTFYKSPAGQAMLLKTPELTAGSMQIVQPRMVELQPKLQAMMQEMMEKMLKASPAKAPSATN